MAAVEDLSMYGARIAVLSPDRPQRIEVSGARSGRLYRARNLTARITTAHRSFFVEDGDVAVVNWNVPHTVELRPGLDRDGGLLVAENPERHNAAIQMAPATMRIRGATPQGGRLGALLDLLESEVDSSEGEVIAHAQYLTGLLESVALCFLVDGGDGAETHEPTPEGTAIRRVAELMHADPGRAWSVATLAAEAGMGRTSFAVQFRSEYNEPPMTYLHALRMERADVLLRRSQHAVGRIAKEVGYESLFAFTRAFADYHGRTPAAMRPGHLRDPDGVPRHPVSHLSSGFSGFSAERLPLAQGGFAGLFPDEGRIYVLDDAGGWFLGEGMATAVDLGPGGVACVTWGTRHAIARSAKDAERLLRGGRASGTGADDGRRMLVGKLPRFDSVFLDVLPPIFWMRGSHARTQSAAVLLRALEQSQAEDGDRPVARLLRRRLSTVVFAAMSEEAFAHQIGLRPDQVRALEDPYVARAIASMHLEPAVSWKVGDLAGIATLSPSAFVRRFRSLTGLSPVAYANRLRAEHAKYLIRATDLPLGRLAMLLGFSSHAAFHRSFAKATGSAPGLFRQAGRPGDGDDIGFALRPLSAGVAD